MLVPQTKEVNDIVLLKFQQHGRRDVACKSSMKHCCSCFKHYTYLTIRFRARNFYEVVVNKGKARVNFASLKLRASSLIVLVKTNLCSK